MITPPPALRERELLATLEEGWSVVIDAIEYRVVGFGSHHRTARDAAGRRWFVTVDDLVATRRSTTHRRSRRRPRIGFCVRHSVAS